jgi:hypothetical protein
MEDDVNELDDYLRANHDAYTREALTRRLVEEGHDPAEVEAAWARIESIPISQWAPSGAPVDAPKGKAGIGTVLLIIVAVVGYGYVGFIGVLGIGFSASGFGGRPTGSLYTIEIPVYVIAMLAGLFVAVRRIWRSPSLGRGASAIGGAFLAAIAILIGISGACVFGTIAVGAVRNVVP